jgi:hypothetical protein
MADGDASPLLAGSDGQLQTAAVPGPRWMTDRAGLLSPRTLAQIALPGTHDSATHALSREPSADDCGAVLLSIPRCLRGAAICLAWPLCMRHWSVTQPLGVRAQLALGVRYLDLRASHDESHRVRAGVDADGGAGGGGRGGGAAGGGVARVAHGTLGEAMEEVFREVAAFLRWEAGEGEVLVLDINHMYNFGSDERRIGGLIDSLLHVLGPWLVREDAALLPLGELLASPRLPARSSGAGGGGVGGGRVVVCLTDEGKGGVGAHVRRCDWLCDSRRLVHSPWPEVAQVGALRERLEAVHAARQGGGGRGCHERGPLHVTQLVLTPGTADVVRGCCLPRCCYSGARSVRELGAAANAAAAGEGEGEGNGSCGRYGAAGGRPGGGAAAGGWLQGWAALNVVLMDWVDPSEDASTLRLLQEIVARNDDVGQQQAAG